MKTKKLRTIGAILSIAGKNRLANKIVGNDNEYKNYFINKMKIFNVSEVSQISPDQWEEIDRDWNSKSSD